MGKLRDWVFGKKLVLKKTFDLSKRGRTLDERMDSSLALSHASRFIDDIILVLEEDSACPEVLDGILIRAKRLKRLLNDLKD